MKAGSKHLHLVFLYSVVSGCGAGTDSEPTAIGASVTPSSTPNLMATLTPTLTLTPTPTPTPTPTNSPAPTPAPSLSTTVLNCGATAGSVVNGELDLLAKEHLLCRHNQTRSEAALGTFIGNDDVLPFARNMQSLQWDVKLEQVAKAWASQCVWEHNANRQSEYNALSPTDALGEALNQTESVGENLAFRGASNRFSASYDFAIAGYDAWEAEGQYWQFGSINNTELCHQEPCGHFTQLIWADTYKVGCAVQYCEPGTLSNFATTYMVCNYASAGNYIAQEPYSVGYTQSEVCSESEADQRSCINGLISTID